MLVNNAGVASVAPLLDADIKKMEAMIDLNVTALTRLTYAAAPGFVARGAGTIINIASVVGISPERLNGVYGATKAFVLALSHSLQHEFGFCRKFPWCVSSTQPLGWLTPPANRIAAPDAIRLSSAADPCGSCA
jgi:NAD(P)-dependent dehydrogenase (short-subunit alcohol dehydrogenase family)